MKLIIKIWGTHYPNLGCYLSHIHPLTGPGAVVSWFFLLSSLTRPQAQAGKTQNDSGSGGSIPVAKQDHRNMGINIQIPACYFEGYEGESPYPWIWIDFRGAVCLRPSFFCTHHTAPPRTDYRYHTRGKHDQFANSAHGESLDASFRYSNMPGTFPIKLDGFSPKTTI